MAAKTLSLSFGVDIPKQARGSRYQELYDLLEANAGQWADVTDAVAMLANQAGAKIPTPQATAITMRKHDGFSATTRTVDGVARVFAGFNVPEEGEAQAEAS